MIRIAAQKQNRNGFTKDVYRDIDYDDRDNYSARLGILFKPWEQLENYLIVWASEYDENGPVPYLHRTIQPDRLRRSKRLFLKNRNPGGS